MKIAVRFAVTMMRLSLLASLIAAVNRARVMVLVFSRVWIDRVLFGGRHAHHDPDRPSPRSWDAIERMTLC
jgi:hypothetical protein